VKYAICNETFQGWDFERTCDYIARTGYDGIEIAPFTLAKSVEDISSSRRSELRKYIERAGLETVGLHWLLAGPDGLHINHPDKSIRDETVAYLKALIHFCADLGGKLLIFGSPKQRSVHPDVSRDLAWQYTVDGFQTCMNDAADRAVTLAIEPLAPIETNFLNTAQEGVKMIQEINHPNFRLHLDVKAMSSEEQPVDTLIRANANWLAHFHANDANLRGPGFGDVDYEPIAAALKDAGYSGYLSVEVFDYKPDPETIATKSLEYLKRFFV
jgi:sugar phosphate isomerase/epimerase